MLKVKDIMTTEVISVSPETEITKAAKILLENRINGLAALLHFLKKQFIDIKYRGKSRCAKDDHYTIDLFEMMLAKINAFAQLFRITGSQHIDGIGRRGTREKESQQFIYSGSLQPGHVHVPLGQLVGQHDRGATRMCNDGQVFSFQGRMKHHRCNCG